MCQAFGECCYSHFSFYMQLMPDLFLVSISSLERRLFDFHFLCVLRVIILLNLFWSLLFEISKIPILLSRVVSWLSRNFGVVRHIQGRETDSETSYWTLQMFFVLTKLWIAELFVSCKTFIHTCFSWYKSSSGSKL